MLRAYSVRNWDTFITPPPPPPPLYPDYEGDAGVDSDLNICLLKDIAWSIAGWGKPTVIGIMNTV